MLWLWIGLVLLAFTLGMFFGYLWGWAAERKYREYYLYAAFNRGRRIERRKNRRDNGG